MPDLRELIPKRVVYALPGMEQVPVTKDLVYRQVGGRHAFDILDNDERSRTIIAHILAFLQRHLLT